MTIIPIVKQFAERHGITDMGVVADAGMLTSANLRDLDEAGLRFIVGSRVTKAPKDLESHFRWHGTAFTDGQVIDTITPRDQRGTAVKTSDPKRRAAGYEHLAEDRITPAAEAILDALGTSAQ